MMEGSGAFGSRKTTNTDEGKIDGKSRHRLDGDGIDGTADRGIHRSADHQKVDVLPRQHSGGDVYGVGHHRQSEVFR